MHQIATMGFHDWHLVESIDPVSDQKLADLGSSDVVVAVGTDPICDCTLRVADYGRSRGARVIGLTDWIDSSLAARAHDVLFASAKSPGQFTSQAATVAVVEALVGTVMERHMDRIAGRQPDKLLSNR